MMLPEDEALMKLAEPGHKDRDTIFALIAAVPKLLRRIEALRNTLDGIEYIVQNYDLKETCKQRLAADAQGAKEIVK